MMLARLSNAIQSAPVFPVIPASAARTENAGVPRQSPVGQAVSATQNPLPRSSGSSATFLAQLFGQVGGTTEDSQIGLLSSFAHFLPAPRYNEFVGYSIVKFRPSDAGLPSFYGTLKEESQAGSSPAPDTAAATTRYANTLIRNTANLVTSGPQFLTAG